ncbi:MerR family transcriptional regulator [uncultured Pseudokineococcus sp.]|uniref:MerR family transcriptional regulator n=1 Tax=uncultured Pseudokineococcus sp. TaxID=1642928 RepID=UPI00260450D0|nr:MerR family transcriptional regulator [uncultured Pseudokineococcus sp.]
MLTIGDFARLTHLSVRTLRRYHEAGLLEPARVGSSSGYRYYEPSQIPTAQVIARLRELDVPLAEVRQILLAPDPGTRSALVAQHLDRLETQLARTQAAVGSLQRLLRPDPDVLDVELVRTPARAAAAVEATVGCDEVLDWYAGAMAELHAVVHAPAGPAGGLYDNALFTDDRGHALVYLPVAGPVPRVGRVHGVELAAVELAATVHHGTHDTIDVTYGELGRWVSEHALVVAGPVHETYLVGPRETPAPDQWRTQIGWPVFSLADAAGAAPTTSTARDAEAPPPSVSRTTTKTSATGTLR